MIDKVYELIDDIENGDLKKKLDEIKKKIKKDEQIKLLLNKFNNAKDLYQKYGYKEDFIKAKVDLMKEPIIKEYLSIQNKINMLSLQINNRIKNITNGVTSKE